VFALGAFWRAIGKANNKPGPTFGALWLAQGEPWTARVVRFAGDLLSLGMKKFTEVYPDELNP
jgi:hypothetical protein